jgi:hypothetical protein
MAPVIQQLGDEAERSGRLSPAWEKAWAGKRLSLEDKADLLLAATNAVQSWAKAEELMCSAVGTTSIYTRIPFEGEMAC